MSGRCPSCGHFVGPVSTGQRVSKGHRRARIVECECGKELTISE